MSTSIELLRHQTHLFVGRVYNHDYLWFSSNEISKVSTTQPVLHNYALCYALSQRSWRTCVGSAPKYLLDPATEFGSMPVYAIPAETSIANRTTVTFNAIDSLTQTTGDSKTMNTPNLGKRVYLNLAWKDWKESHNGFEVFAFTFGDYVLPTVFRLGKKGCPIRAIWNEVKFPVATFEDSEQQPSHPVNPLDVSGDVRSYEPVPMPPHFLMRATSIENDWFVRVGGITVHVPKRVVERSKFQ